MSVRSCRAFAAAIGVIALTGCGTTVAAVSGQPVGNDLAAPTSAAGQPAQGAASSTGTTTAGGAVATGNGGAIGAPSTTSGGSAPTGGAPGTSSGGAIGGPGITASTVRIGVYTADSSYAQAAKSVLGPAGDLGDPAKYYQDLAANFNQTHRLAGRKLQLVIRTIAPTTTDQTSQDQAACTEFTQDQPVLGVITDVASPTLVACTSKAGIPTVQTAATFDDAALQAAPYLVLPISTTMNTFATALVKSLAARGFFTNNGTPAVVGVLHDDVPAYQRAFDQALVPALHAAGVTHVVEATSAYPSNDQLGKSSSDINNAVLRFRSSNVSRVLFLSTSAWEPSAFMNDAASQHYTPRYGLSSQNFPYTVSTLISDKSQLTGALGIGWLPSADVAQHDDPLANSVARRNCMSVLRKGGDEPSSSTAYTDATLVCDQFNAIVQAALHPGGLSGRSGLFASMLSGRTGFQPNDTFASRLNPRTHTGAMAWRPLSWQSCQCFRYDGSEQKF